MAKQLKKTPAKKSTKNKSLAKKRIATDAPDNGKTPGGRLGGIAGVILSISFFLPWVRSCNREYSGYDIATDPSVQDAWLYWAPLLAGLLLIAMYFLFKTYTAPERIRLATTRLVLGLTSSFPLIWILNRAQSQSNSVDILYGIWATVAGYTLVFVSFLADLGGPEPENGQKKDT